MKLLGYSHIIFIVIGILGLCSSAKRRASDLDPQFYYVTAGKILGRPTSVNANTIPPTDPLFEQVRADEDQKVVQYAPMMPYRDFVCEYPPAALVPLILPRLFTDDVLEYYRLFSAEMAIPAIAGLWVAFRIAQLLKPGRSAAGYASAGWMIWIWTSGGVLLHRIDVCIAFCIGLAMLNVLQRSWGRAGLFIGCGTALRIFPILLLPPLIIISFADSRWRAAIRLLAASILAPALSHLVLMPWTGLHVFNYFVFHRARGVEVESIWAQLIQVVGYIKGESIGIEFKFGCDQLVSRMNLRPWIILTYVAMIVANMICTIVALLRIARLDCRTLNWRVRVSAIVLSVTAFTIITAKVLSIQYVFWLYPIATILPGGTGRGIAAAYAVALAQGQFWYPGNWWMVSHLVFAATTLVFVRNIVLIGISAGALWLAANFTELDSSTRQQSAV